MKSTLQAMAALAFIGFMASPKFGGMGLVVVAVLGFILQERSVKDGV
jgi:hypothetical protein